MQAFPYIPLMLQFIFMGATVAWNSMTPNDVSKLQIIQLETVALVILFLF
jgi:hypothetical protein